MPEVQDCGLTYLMFIHRSFKANGCCPIKVNDTALWWWTRLCLYRCVGTDYRNKKPGIHFSHFWAQLIDVYLHGKSQASSCQITEVTYPSKQWRLYRATVGEEGRAVYCRHCLVPATSRSLGSLTDWSNLWINIAGLQALRSPGNVRSA